MTLLTSLRRCRNLLVLLVAALPALVVLPASADTSSSASGKPAPGVQVSIASDSPGLNIATGQCAGAPIVVRLANTGTQAVYTDVTLSAPRALVLQRSMISTYLPAGYTASVSVPVMVPLGTRPGRYQVTVSSGKSVTGASVTVTATTPDTSGNLARSAARISASSVHSGYPVCGAVDGDTDSEHWATTTGWNDGNSGIWPDWFELQWDSAQTVGHVTVYALNSVKYPAARYGMKDWDIQTLDDGEWKTIASVRGNTQGVVDTTFDPVRTTALRVLLLACNGANDYSRLVELQAFAS